MTGVGVPLWLVAALCPLFAIVAALYSAVGLGGGSGYVAIMVLSGLPAENIPSTALLLNIGVTGVALFRHGSIDRMKLAVLLPFLIPAIPAALLGGLCHAPHRAFFAVLAGSLLFAAAATFRSAQQADREPRTSLLKTRLAVGIPFGVVIGFVSGLVGIGGGVFAGPLILALRWAGPKEVAAINALLIFVLSIVGLLGHGIRGTISLPLIVPFAVATIAGGLIGAQMGARWLSPATLQKLFAVIVFVAGAKAVLDAIG